MFKRAMLLAGVVASCVVVGQAVASSRPPSAAAKPPKAVAARVSGLRFVVGPVVTAAAEGSGGIAVPADSVAVCPRGLHALSGGWDSSDSTDDAVTISSNEEARRRRTMQLSKGATYEPTRENKLKVQRAVAEVYGRGLGIPVVEYLDG